MERPADTVHILAKSIADDPIRSPFRLKYVLLGHPMEM